MSEARTTNVLLLSCFNRGDRFAAEAKRRGAKVWLLTKAKYLGKPWPRDLLEDVFAEPDAHDMRATIDSVSFLTRRIRFDVIVPLDDVEVDTAAALREHLRIPGMGISGARLFRDKLAMRVKAGGDGIPVPAFSSVLHHPDLAAFIARVPGPWMLKPRAEAATTGIRKITSAEMLWRTLEELGDKQSHFLLEKFVPGDVFHVDAITVDGKVVFAAAHRNGVPPFEVASGGGMFTTSTVEHGGKDETELFALNERVLASLGLSRGVSHVEFIRGREDGTLYFLEAGARVGGAHVADVVEAATGINLWAEWAKLEINPAGEAYALPATRSEYAGLVQTLARTERPDTSAYNDPEIVLRTDDPHHAGLIVRSTNRERVDGLLKGYAARFGGDFLAVMPQRTTIMPR